MTSKVKINVWEQELVEEHNDEFVDIIRVYSDTNNPTDSKRVCISKEDLQEMNPEVGDDIYTGYTLSCHWSGFGVKGAHFWYENIEDARKCVMAKKESRLRKLERMEREGLEWLPDDED